MHTYVSGVIHDTKQRHGANHRSVGARVRTDFIRGMGRVDGRFVIILEVARVFSVGEIAEISALAEA
jgi:hypothetical protein